MKGTRKMNESFVRSRQTSQSTLFTAKSTPSSSRRQLRTDFNQTLDLPPTDNHAHFDNHAHSNTHRPQHDSTRYEEVVLPSARSSSSQLTEEKEDHGRRRRSKSTDSRRSRQERRNNRDEEAGGRAASQRSLNHQPPPAKSAKPSRDEVERRVRRMKQKKSMEMLLNKERTRLKQKYSDGDSTSVCSHTYPTSEVYLSK